MPTTNLKAQSPGTRIRRDIIEQIGNGELLPDEALMTIAQLSQHYRVARKTVLRAVQGLAKDGYLYSRRGSGTYVRDRRQQQPKAKTKVRLRLPGKSRHKRAGMLAFAERFNAGNHDIHLDVIGSEAADERPEVIVVGSLTPGPDCFRLDTMPGFDDTLRSLHPRLQEPELIACGGTPLTYLPIHWSTRCFAVASDQFSASGADVPKTWDDLLEWTVSKQHDTGHPTFLFHAANDPVTKYLPYYWMAGGHSFRDPHSGECQVDRAALVRMFDFLRKLSQCATLIDQAEPIEPLLTGPYAFNLFTGTWIKHHAEQLAPSPAYQLHLPPVPGRDVSPCSTLTFTRVGIAQKTITETGKAACWAVIRALLSADAQRRMNAVFGTLPALNSFWEGWDDDPDRRVWARLLETGRPLDPSPVGNSLRASLEIEFFRFFTEDRSATEAADSFAAVAEAICRMNKGAAA